MTIEHRPDRHPGGKKRRAPTPGPGQLCPQAQIISRGAISAALRSPCGPGGSARPRHRRLLRRRGPVRAGWQRGRGHWLLARRSLSDPAEIAYYACYGPRRSSTADLAWTAGSRWHIEEAIQQAKGEAGLDHYQVRAWRAWHAHITPSMLALPCLPPPQTPPQNTASAPPTP